MKYKDLKIVEELNVTRVTSGIVRYMKKDCSDEKRINQQITNVRKNIEKYPEKRNVVVKHLNSIGFPTIGKLIKDTIYPIRLAGAEVQQIGLDGFSLPLYRKSMCGALKGSGGSDIGGKDGTATTGGKDGTATTGGKDGTATTGGKDGTATTGGKDGSTGQTINDKFGTEMQTFGNFLDNNDLEGALAFLDGNPGFATAIGPKFRTDIQSALDAREAKERNRLAQEKADKEAKEAQRIADEKAAKEAKEKADAAAEAKRIADAEEQKRLDAIEAERKAAKAKKAKDEADAKAERERQQAELDRLEKQAEEARIAAEKLEKERIEAEAEAKRIADEEAKKKADSSKTDDNSEGVEEFDWEDLQ